MDIVKVENLVKRYGDKIALDHFNIDVKEGEILGLIGPNGCGKTTAINCILSLLNFDKGEIEVFGSEMKPNSYDLKRRIGVVPQELALFYELTVYENIDYFCSLYVKDKKERKILVEDAIKFVHLEEYRNFIPKKLSGGLKRRLNIACGISHKPELIILDEPTVAVDAQNRNFILEGIKELNLSGSTIIYTTHYLEEAEKICTRIVIMDSGKSIASGSVKELKNMISIKERICIKFVDINQSDIEEIKTLDNITSIEEIDNEYVLLFDKSSSNLSNLIRLLDDRSLAYTSLYSEEPILNDVFLEMTGKDLRD